jgi:hypothetical protein
MQSSIYLSSSLLSRRLIPFAVVFLTFFIGACSSDDEEPCSVQLNESPQITHKSVTVSVRTSGSNVTEKGVVYSFIPNPTTNDNQVVYGSSAGDFQVRIDSLERNTTYYVRAYIICDGQAQYSNELGFTTSEFVVLDYHGSNMVISSTDNAQLIPWGPSDTLIGANSTSDGAFNTQLLEPLTENYAAQVCSRFRGGGHDDWYLPSEDELVFIYQNRKEIGNIRPNNYWASTEASPTAARSVNMISGGVSSAPKSSLGDCRCIRKAD